MDNFEPSVAQPLSGMSYDAGDIKIEGLPASGKITLRGAPKQLKAPLKKALGLALPEACGQFVVGEQASAVWLGPDEWQLGMSIDALEDVLARLTDALAQVHSQLVDVSDYYCTIRLSGPLVREVLSKNTPFDMDRSRFEAGSAYRTRFAKATVILFAHSDTEFTLQTRWSYAQYIYALLAESCQAYQR